MTARTARLTSIAALSVIAVVVAALAARPSAALAAPAADTQAAPSSFALQVIAIINEERTDRGLPALGTDVRLFNASEDHTEWMITHNTFSHRGAGGSTPAERALAAGYRYSALGEALARGHTSPEMVVRGRSCDRYCITSCDSNRRCDGWKQSPAHWRILMGSSYRDIGSAYMRGYSSRPHWWTVMVGNSYDPPMPLGSGSTPATPTDVPPTSTDSPPTHTPKPPTVTPTPLPPSPTSDEPTATRLPTRTPRPSATATRVPPATATSAPTGFGTVSGCVVYDAYGPMANVDIRVDGATRASTGSDGCFTVHGVPAGRRNVEARLDGALSSRSAAEIVAGRTANLGTTRLLGGDAVPDDAVDLLDLLTVAAARGRCEGRSGYSRPLDVDLDGCIGDSDFNIVWGRVGRSGPTHWTLNP